MDAVSQVELHVPQSLHLRNRDRCPRADAVNSNGTGVLGTEAQARFALCGSLIRMRMRFLSFAVSTDAHALWVCLA